MNINTDFLACYLNEVTWEVIRNLEDEAGSRYTAYCNLINFIGDKNADEIDKRTETRGDAMYVAAGICGDAFWSAFADHIKWCLDIDVEDEDLNQQQASRLKKLVKVTVG